jgi:hypothetical protein
MKNYVLLILTIFLLLNSGFATAQSFSYQSSEIPPMSRSSFAFGDYDNDGDLDMVIGGMINAFEAATYLFENQEGTFVQTDTELPAVSDGVVLFADVDMDGDMDIFLSGNGNSDSFTALYMNDGGVFTANDTDVAPMGGNTDAAFGDYDEDGDLDLVVSGNDETFLYNYDAGVFTEVDHPFVNLNYATAKWVDYDNDGDLDLALAGELGAVPATRIYTNAGGEFEESGIVLQDVMSGDMAWGDYDNDGDKDLAIVGYDEYLTGQTVVYRNDGDGAFKNIGVNILGVSNSAVDWGDVNNDGKLDLLVSGNCDDCGVLMTSVFTYEGGTFVDAFPGFQNANRGEARFIDYDNDGDSDVIITGEDLGGNYIASVYQNDDFDNEYHANEAPEKTQSLIVENLGNEVMLQWEPAADDYTPQSSLTYNVRVGTTSGSSDVVNSMCGADGSMLLPQMGNANQSLTLSLTHLPVGTYYWSVQTVDHQYKASDFSDEQSFTITSTHIVDQESQMKVYPVPFNENVTITLPESGFHTAALQTLSGKILLQKEISGDQMTFNTTGLPKGVYILQIHSEDEVISKKIVK